MEGGLSDRAVEFRPLIAAGFGFRASASVESLKDALGQTGYADKLSLISVPADKADSPILKDFAAQTGLPVARVDARTLTAQDTVTHSAASRRSRGAGSVAEAAALAAVGSNGRLLVTRVVSWDRLATCAVAEGERS